MTSKPKRTSTCQLIVAETRALFVLGWPVVLTYLLSFSIPLVTLAAVGQRMSAAHLAGASLGQMTFNITGASVLMGLLSGMDTLCSQAYGRGSLREIGDLLLRALLVCGCACVPIAMLWLFGVEPLLGALGQDAEVARHAATYVRTMTLALPALGAFEALKRFLQSQNVVKPMLLVAAVTLPPHVLLCRALVGDSGQAGAPASAAGFLGAPMCNVLSYALMLLLLLAYMRCRRPHEAETEPAGGACSAAAWRRAADGAGVRRYLRYGLGGMLMLALEWWSFEVMALGAGIMGTTHLAAHAVLANVVPLAFMLPLGISVAAGVRIGNLLGASRPADARRTACFALALAAALSVLTSSSVLAVRRSIAGAFSADEAVASLAAATFPTACVFMLLDYLQGVSQGVARGTGRQGAGAAIIGVGTWLVGLPVGFALAFVPGLGPALGIVDEGATVGGRTGGLRGLWTGLIVGYCAVDVAFLALFARLDWSKAAREAAEGGENAAFDAVPTSGVDDAGSRPDGTEGRGWAEACPRDRAMPVGFARPAPNDVELTAIL
jgi:MATE family multidrug resistance protein